MNLLKRLIQKDSYYLVLAVCISVLAVSGIWVSKGKTNTAEKKKIERNSEKQVAVEESKITEEEIKLDLSEKNFTRKTKKEPKLEIVPPIEDVAQVEKPIEAPVEKKQAVVTPSKDTKSAKVEPAKPEQAKAQVPVKKQADQSSQAQAVASGSVEVKVSKLKKPVAGTISKDFSKDKLVYSKTLEEWSTHVGIDIAASEGTDVVAALDGIVKKVIKDERLGITIILDHGNGLETIYKNIATEKLVSTGQNVKTGQTISKVSKGVGFEKLEQPHLHFEVLKAGVHIDPKSMF